METFKYVGKRPNSDLRTVGGQPVNHRLFLDHERSTFRRLFRDQVAATVRQAGNPIQAGVYENLPGQIGAFDRLEAVLAGYPKFVLGDITRASNEKDEFLCRVQVRVPTLPEQNTKLFTKPVPDDYVSYALVSFYTGVCREFVSLIKKNELVEKAMAEFAQNATPGNVQKTLSEAAAQQLVREDQIKDEAFDPEKVIPGVIKNLRLEPRYTYIRQATHLNAQRYYQTPEGFVYRLEIDGYATSPR